MRVKISIEPDSGQTIDSAAVAAMNWADKYDTPIALTFNDTTVIVLPNDTADNVIRDWTAVRRQAQRAKL